MAAAELRYLEKVKTNRKWAAKKARQPDGTLWRWCQENRVFEVNKGKHYGTESGVGLLRVFCGERSWFARACIVVHPSQRRLLRCEAEIVDHTFAEARLKRTEMLSTECKSNEVECDAAMQQFEHDEGIQFGMAVMFQKLEMTQRALTEFTRYTQLLCAAGWRTFGQKKYARRMTAAYNIIVCTNMEMGRKSEASRFEGRAQQFQESAKWGTDHAYKCDASTFSGGGIYHEYLRRWQRVWRERRTCTFCRKQSRSRMKLCGGCLQRRYCSRSCQKRDWNGGHGALCNIHDCML